MHAEKSCRQKKSTWLTSLLSAKFTKENAKSIIAEDVFFINEIIWKVSSLADPAAWLEKPVWTGRDLPLRAPVISNSISWVGPGGDHIYNENGQFLLLLVCFSATAIVVEVVLGPLIYLGTLFLEGPQGLVPSTFGIISPALSSRRF